MADIKRLTPGGPNQEGHDDLSNKYRLKRATPARPNPIHEQSEKYHLEKTTPKGPNPIHESAYKYHL
ncbi:CLAVATA3/ESR (CLE)-related protein [Corchorus olitorius]|uniref:CLAVATA3/ESR (CLE)-related protein n=1 Tax=Corchorus olitorius TaxID=93759 RepID=A0A1R3HNE7_9ROSI|nr:CLAVATA3/ESR (CLE)-related protein [Corchorus olitorius]